MTQINRLKVAAILLGSIFILSLAFVTFVLIETQDEINATPENIAEKLNSYYNENRMAGFGVSVFDADKVYFQGGFGFADLEARLPYTSKTLQYTASVCKTTIGICLMKAQELGYFNLDDPINQHLPFSVTNPHFPELDISIYHLATHTSSLDYNEEVVESLYVDEADKDSSLEGFVWSYFEEKAYGEIAFTQDKPGKNWNYSNIGAGLAAYLIEYTTGMSYADFSQKYIFDPLEMESGWFRLAEDNREYASYYEPEEGKPLLKVAAKGVKLYPVRDLLTNAEDLTKYAQSVLRRDTRLLSASSFDKMLSPALTSSITGQEIDNHGIFWMMDRNQYGIVYSLTGSNGGDNCINTMMWLDLHTNLGYIFMGNTGGSKASKVNHIFIYRTLVSLGDWIKMNDPEADFWDKLSHTWYNISSRIGALF